MKRLAKSLLTIILFAGGCAPLVEPAANREMIVLAAASLTESFTEIGLIFESQNPGVSVAFSFAGSHQLAQQLSQGLEADVYASASSVQMDAVMEAGRVDPSGVSPFVHNRLVVIYPKNNPAGIASLMDLARPGLLLDTADPSVPVGQYTLDFLSKASQDPTFGADFEENVLDNVISYEDSVKAVVTKVSLGEADAGIVYATDVTPAVASSLRTLEIPEELNTIASYPIAVISDSDHPDLAKAFVALVLSQEGQAVLEKYGFVPTGD